MSRVPVFLCVDLEPVEREVQDSSSDAWRGVDAIVEWLEALRPGLAEVSGDGVRLLWFLRCDPQIEVAFGAPNALMLRSAGILERLLDGGDPIGLHTHPWRWDEDEASWIADYARPGLDRALRRDVLRGVPRSLRSALRAPPIRRPLAQRRRHPVARAAGCPVRLQRRARGARHAVDRSGRADDRIHPRLHPGAARAVPRVERRSLPPGPDSALGSVDRPAERGESRLGDAPQLADRSQGALSPPPVTPAALPCSGNGPAQARSGTWWHGTSTRSSGRTSRSRSGAEIRSRPDEQRVRSILEHLPEHPLGSRTRLHPIPRPGLRLMGYEAGRTSPAR